MLRFWVREILGWCLVAAGLYVFLVLLSNLLAPPPTQPRIFEAPVIAAIGIVVFRGGIHLLKVAVAARVCLQAQTAAKKEPTPARKSAADAPPWDW